MGTNQLNVRIPDQFRDLLRLLAYLEDASESVLVCAGLVTLARDMLTTWTSAEGYDPADPETRLLIKVLSRCDETGWLTAKGK